MTKKSNCSIMQLRREGGDIIARVKIAGERVVVTDYGKPQAAIVSLEDLAQLEGYAKYDAKEAISIKQENIGGSFDDLLREEGIYGEVKAKSRKKLTAWVKSRQPIKSKKR